MRLERFLPLDLRRRKALRSAPAGPLRDYLAIPFAPRRADVRRLRFLALDLETTGLDPAEDEIVSAGWVALEADAIHLASARHAIVAPARAMPEASAVLHGITDDAAARGIPPRQMLVELLAALAGRVLVAHNAAFELAMVDAACERLLGGRFLAPAVDTMRLARGWLESRGAPPATPEATSLRLAAVRRRHNLPRHRVHDALSDALAAAELFLAQVAERDHGRPLRLGSVLARV